MDHLHKYSFWHLLTLLAIGAAAIFAQLIIVYRVRPVFEKAISLYKQHPVLITLPADIIGISIGLLVHVWIKSI